MKIIYNRFIPTKGYMAINLCGVLFVRNEYRNQVNKVELNHERIHSRQIIEMLVLPFYLFYLIEWLFKLAKYRNQRKAYLSISFEREAYRFQSNLNYLKHRKPYAWVKFLRK